MDLWIQMKVEADNKEELEMELNVDIKLKIE